MKDIVTVCFANEENSDSEERSYVDGIYLSLGLGCFMDQKPCPRTSL